MIACIRIPYFATTVEQHQLAEAASKPLLVARYTGKRGLVRAVCSQTEAAGVEVGMPVSRALALCPDVRTVLFPAHRYRRSFQSVMDSLTHFSQWIDGDRRSIQTAILYVDLGKIRPREGWQIAQLIIDRLRDEHAFTASIGLAASKFPAYVAAFEAETGGIRLVPLGEEKDYLAPFPVAFLPLDKEAARRLTLFGIRTIRTTGDAAPRCPDRAVW